MILKEVGKAPSSMAILFSYNICGSGPETHQGIKQDDSSRVL
jgi:hypothetical protein